MIICMILISVETKSQSDGFFSYQNELREYEDEWGRFVLLPEIHGLDYNCSADNAPIESGLLMLMVMGVCYGMQKRYRK